LLRPYAVQLLSRFTPVQDLLLFAK
jgi:hypothetical protein